MLPKNYLYNGDFEINDLLRQAHPGGDKIVIDEPTGEGVIEDSIGAQMKLLQMVVREPASAILSQLANDLDQNGFSRVANKTDKILTKVALSDNALAHLLSGEANNWAGYATQVEIDTAKSVLRKARTTGRIPPAGAGAPQPTGPAAAPKPAGSAGTVAPKLLGKGSFFSRLPLRFLGRASLVISMPFAVYDIYRAIDEGIKAWQEWRGEHGLWDSTLENISSKLSTTIDLLKSGGPGAIEKAQTAFNLGRGQITAALRDKDLDEETRKKLLEILDQYNALDEELGSEVAKHLKDNPAAHKDRGGGRPSENKYAYSVQRVLVANHYSVGTKDGKPDGVWGKTSNASLLAYTAKLVEPEKTAAVGAQLSRLVGKTAAETYPNLASIYKLLSGEGHAPGEALRKDTWLIDFDTADGKHIKDFPIAHTIKYMDINKPEMVQRSSNIHRQYMIAYGALAPGSDANAFIVANQGLIRALKEKGFEAISNYLGPMADFFTELERNGVNINGTPDKSVWDLLAELFGSYAGPNHTYFSVVANPNAKRGLLYFLMDKDLANDKGMALVPKSKLSGMLPLIEDAVKKQAMNAGLR